jgi:hypothetical protein
LEFFFSIKKIVSDQFGDICNKSQFGNLKKRYDNGYYDDNYSKKQTYYFGSPFGKSIERSQCQRNSSSNDKQLNNRNS